VRDLFRVGWIGSGGRKRKKRKKEEETTTQLQENTPPRATRQPGFESKIQVLQILATQFS